MLSGNRNFEGRVNPLVKANYLASPPLVVAYALAGTTDIDLLNEPLGQDPAGDDVMLARHLADAGRDSSGDCRSGGQPEMFVDQYQSAFDFQREVECDQDQHRRDLYDWDAESTYIQEPPFLVELTAETSPSRAAFTAPACWPCWAIRSPPTTSRRPARSPRTARPAGT